MSTEGAAEWRASHDARKNQLADEQRQAQEALLANQVSSGALTPAQYGQGINDLYAHEPAESRLGRIGRGLAGAVGIKTKAPQQPAYTAPTTTSQTPSTTLPAAMGGSITIPGGQGPTVSGPAPRTGKQDLANIEAQAKTPQQLAEQL